MTSIGDMRPTLEDRFNISLTLEIVEGLFDSGHLTNLLPDGDWWFVQAFEDGEIESIEWATSEHVFADQQLSRLVPAGAQTDGGMLIRQTLSDGTRMIVKPMPSIDLYAKLFE